MPFCLTLPGCAFHESRLSRPYIKSVCSILGEKPISARESIHVLGVRIDNVTLGEAVRSVESFLVHGGLYQIATVNPEFVVQAQTNDRFKQVLNQCSLNVPDGVGLLWATKRLGTPLRERVTGQDLVDRISALASRCQYPVFLLGAQEGVAELAGKELSGRYPTLVIAGCHAGSPEAEFDPKIRDLIRRSGARILFVAYGPPKQELWIARNAPQLDVSIAVGVGGTFDTLAGLVPRAPRLLRDAGFEWTYRLFREPRRLRRQMAIPYFMWLVLTRGKKTSKV